MNADHRIFRLGDLPLQRGGVLREARLAYATYGTLNAARDNCVVFPTYYTGTHASNARIIGPGRALDPDRWFIVVPNLFGNGVSSSPSNTPAPCGGADFPQVTIYDNVQAQHRLVFEELGASRVALATGWSMGALQAWAWAALYPEAVERLLPFCGAARCWPLNGVFLDGVRAALQADGNYRGGRYDSPPSAGLKAFARVYAGWAYSPAFYREALYRRHGYEDLEAFMRFWEEDHLAWDANDLLAKLWTWRHADVGDHPRFGGDWQAALRGVRARTLVVPCTQDRYFTLEENAIEAGLVQGAELRPLDSPYGHVAGGPGRLPEETAFIEQAMRDLLAR